MFVKILSVDDWREKVNYGKSIDNPTWHGVEQAIASLDGRQRTIVTLSDAAGSQHYMIIAGKHDGRLLVNTTTDNWSFYSLIDPRRSDRKQLVCVGGQDGEYEDRKFVPVDWAIQAAREFFDTGQRKASLDWISEYD